MDVKYVVPDLKLALKEKLFPTITVWNRLEGRPRRADFDRALKAEVRDPLWMLTKQWQIGEFKADDAGSPVVAKLQMRAAPVTKYQPGGGATEAFEPNVPLETKAEQRSVRWVWNGQKMRLDLRAQLGRQWRRMLNDAGLAAYASQYLDLYPITLPPQDETTDYVYAHRHGWQQYAALAGRGIDGGDLHLFLGANPGNRASDGITLAGPADKAKLDDLGDEFERWFSGLYYQPDKEDAWKPPYLEYQFACSVPKQGKERVLAAEEYAQGRLDWYSFDYAPGSLGAAADPGEQFNVSSFLPSPVSFQGMPDPRWWALEDRKTDFGAVKPSTTDLAQLLLMEFALVYADDWFLVPFRLPAGTLAHVEGLAVTNTFGERFWITAAGTGIEQNWHRWAMFQINSEGLSERQADTSLFIPPVVAKTMDGDPEEEVELARDEVANMVWAIEKTIPSVAGTGRSGKDEGLETVQYHERLVAAGGGAPPPFQAGIAYLAMTGVPEHFIPFVPVHVPNSVREVQLQRSRMLRIIEGDPLPPEKIPPRTTLVRQGLDEAVKQPYFLHEEEVPRAGIIVSQSFRRTRWTKGEAYVWLGVQKQVGRGERSSGLAFDRIVNSK
ncbi:MAG TPA: hypothetical protein VLT16_17850 [Candidatus Limnocylindrales bacterium]|nr:hypothetical protein [Candidatus Limnocylindrales bacterium]